MKEFFVFINQNSNLLQLLSTLVLTVVTCEYVRLTKFLVWSQDAPVIHVELSIDTTQEINQLYGKISNVGNKPTYNPFVELIDKKGGKAYHQIALVVNERDTVDVSIPIVCPDDNIPSICNVYYSTGISVVKVCLDFDAKSSVRTEYRHLKKYWFRKQSNLAYYTNQSQK